MKLSFLFYSFLDMILITYIFAALPLLPRGLFSSCGRPSCFLLRCAGFPPWRLPSLQRRASAAASHGLSSCASHALEHRLDGCGSWASVLRGRRTRDQPCLLHWQADTTGLPWKLALLYCLDLQW